ncbi:MAG: hypothetical protein D6768_13880 [Chloroflexi bacterium]|nr:MAG: hypothetical protein D6768_13880 [Chloroflexota bacterium]
MSIWSVFFWLIVTFLLLYPLNRWINTHVQGVAFLLTGSPRVAVWVFWVFFLPGTLLHELSHWVTAKLLHVKTRGFSVWPKQKRSGELQMGAVQVEVSDPFRHAIIGVAPLIFGSVAVLLIGYGWLGLERVGAALLDGYLDEIWRELVSLLAVPDVWLWFYLIFAISNAMLPSASDREAWRTVVIYLALALLLALGLGVNPRIPAALQDVGLTIITYLLVAFTITIVVDLIVIVLLFLLETVAGLLLGRRVNYGR